MDVLEVTSVEFFILRGCFRALAGWIASLVMKTDAEQGAVANIIIGIVGAIIGGFISRLLGGPEVTGFNLVSIVIATLGAIVLLFILRAFRRPHHTQV